MTAVLNILNLHKNYGNQEVLKGLDVTLEAGKMLALLGPNGAGKSTTIDVISTLSSFSSGTVQVCGFERPFQDGEIRVRLGIVFQNSVLDERLSIKENLSIRSSLYTSVKRKSKIQEFVRLCGLQEQLNQPVGTLSGGERRKADIARALLASPQLLILDEPTTGLDPQARRQIWQLIKELRDKQNLSILLTTHYIEEAEHADDLAIISQGKIRMHTTPEHLKAISKRNRLLLYPHDTSSLCRKLNIQRISYTMGKEQLIVPLQNSFQALTIIQAVRPYLINFEVREGTLEEAYLDVLGGEEYAVSHTDQT
ncbi:MAG: ABC transporter ATP-binding protein [Erysipelotrichaceae bacterium]|nr:ABC transporter ATP-binding protein [Erysipelotrichaceae bacterium]